MRAFRALVVSLVFSIAGGAAAAEEQESPLGRFNYFVGASAGIPVARSADAFELGYGVTLGVRYRFTSRLAAQIDYLYSTNDLQSDLLPEGGDLTGSQRLQWSTLDVSYELVPPGKVASVRLIGGPGIYWRRVEVSEITGVELSTFCEPFLFICFPAPTPVTTALGGRSSTDFGLNAGVNLGLSLGFPVRVFVEPRFHYIFGPRVSTPTGDRRANGYYLPIVLGFQYF